MTNSRPGLDEEGDPVPAGPPSMKERKVVVKLRSGEVLKGHLILQGVGADDSFWGWNQNGRTAITVRSLNSNAPVEILRSSYVLSALIRSTSIASETRSMTLASVAAPAKT